MQTYATGRAARELGVPQSVLRALCQAGVIAVRVTEGGHWRIPQEEMERLRRDGVPELPPPPTEQPGTPPLHTSTTAGSHAFLLANPSESAIAAADQAVVLESQVKSLELQRAREKHLDWFRDRRQRQALAQACERKRALEKRASRLRGEWLAQWVAYALDCLPNDAPKQIGLDVRLNVEETLASLDPGQPRDMTHHLVLAAVEKSCQPWRRRKEIEKSVQDARSQLPALAQGWTGSPSEWDIRATKAAADAVSRLNGDCPLAEIRAVCAEAGRQVRAEYQRHDEHESHRRVCERLVERVLDGDEAREAARKALARLPVGATEADMTKARDAALAPFHATKKAGSTADSYLRHVDTYIEELGAENGEWHLGGFMERWRLAEELKEQIRPKLIQALLRDDFNEEEAREFIEEMVDAHL